MLERNKSLEPLINASVGSENIRNALGLLPVDQAQLLMIDCGFFGESGNGQETQDIKDIAERHADALRSLYRSRRS